MSSVVASIYFMSESYIRNMAQLFVSTLTSSTSQTPISTMYYTLPMLVARNAISMNGIPRCSEPLLLDFLPSGTISTELGEPL